jgi:AbrB family looped-hinge helix DNA binding protein
MDDMAHTSADAHTEPESHTLAVGERGRVVIPANLRRALGIGRGSILVAHVEDGRRLVLEDRKALAADMRGAWQRRTVAAEAAVQSRADVTGEPGAVAGVEAAVHSRADVTGELLAERRAEAALEDAKVTGDERAVARARRRLGKLKELHDAQHARPQ